MYKWFKMHTNQFGLGGIALGVFLVLTVLAFSSPASVEAAPQLQGTGPENASCLFCHSEQGKTVDIGGQPLSLTIDGAVYDASVHGEEDIACVDCHTNITTFPHPEVTASSIRDFSIELYPTCQQCHSDQYAKTLDSVHQREIAAGNNNAAVCSDCHDPHSQARLHDESTGDLMPDVRVEIARTFDPLALISSTVRKYSCVDAVELQIKKTTAPRMSMPPNTNLLNCISSSDVK